MSSIAVHARYNEWTIATEGNYNKWHVSSTHGDAFAHTPEDAVSRAYGNGAQPLYLFGTKRGAEMAIAEMVADGTIGA